MIFTSYFGNVKKLKQAGIVPVSIARYNPKWFNGLRIIELAPKSNMLRMSNEEYDPKYRAILRGLNPKKIVEKIEILGNGKPVALLCYEKDPLECHRSMVADWLKNAGYDSDEWHSDFSLFPSK